MAIHVEWNGVPDSLAGAGAESFKERGKLPSFRLDHRRSNALVVIALLVVSLVASPLLFPEVGAPSEKVVYVVICVDTEMYGGHDPYLGSSNPNPTMDMRCFARSPPSTVSAIFDSGFRNSHRDPSGNPFKMTWFAEMDYLMAQSNFVWEDGSSAGVSGYTAVYDILKSNWGTEIQTYGDSLEYHHHFMIYDGTWQRYDNGPDEGYPEYQMYALDRMIIDRGFYPTVWRSGWLIMSLSLSSWLEQWMPLDYTPDTGIWYPVHPSGMNRWQTRTSGGSSQAEVNEAFARARDYGSAIYSFYCHDRDNMVNLINGLHSYLVNADNNNTNYPNVTFKYVSAKEAMQRALSYTDFTAPSLSIARNGGTYTITSNEPLWKNHPYVALNYADGAYKHMEATPAGANTWTITPPNQIVTEENVALLARAMSFPVSAVTASSYRSGHEPPKAVDGNTDTYWDSTSGTCPQWLKLDLGSIQSFNSIRTHFWDGDSRQYAYYIEISNNDSTWTQVTTTKYVHGIARDDFNPPLTARYIKITVTDNTGPNEYAHIREVDVSQESGVAASSYDGSRTPDLAIDGIESTSNYWGTNALVPEGRLPQWLKLDLRSPEALSKITTHFYDGDARTYTYYIEVSNDDSVWTTVVPSKTGSGSVTDTFPQVKARYVRITVTGNTASNAAHIEEIKVYRVTTSQLDSIGVAASDFSGNASTQLFILGDVNNDGHVNIQDLWVLGKAYSSIVGQPAYKQEADLDNDGNIDSDDLVIQDGNFGQGR